MKPKVEFLWMTDKPLETIERAGRTCYKSEDKITENSAETFVRMLLRRGHHAMIEHASASYKVICDRGVTHEIVRHRLFSYAQESIRYCNYKDGVTFIIPCWFPKEFNEGVYRDADVWATHWQREIAVWLRHLYACESAYIKLIEQWSPQQARSVLPNALKTEIVITGNLREWMHFFKLRTDKAAHPQMQEVANMLLEDIRNRIPVIFEDYGNGEK
jgi:thymidylate synthase (FAD)